MKSERGGFFRLSEWECKDEWAEERGKKCQTQVYADYARQLHKVRVITSLISLEYSSNARCV